MIVVRLVYLLCWKFWNVLFGNGNVVSRDSDWVSVGLELVSDFNIGLSCCSLVIRFVVVLLIELMVRVLNLFSCLVVLMSVFCLLVSIVSVLGMVVRV